MTWLSFWQAHLWISYFFIGIISLAIGSFLNVVIFRYPIMLKRCWRAECQEFLQIPIESEANFNIVNPRSHCPHCHKTIPFAYNIPIISYCILKGKCAHCRQPISIQYLVIELLCLITTLTVFISLGLSLPALIVCILTWGLIVIAAIDWRHQLIPDSIIYPLLWLGLLVNLRGMFTNIHSAVIGAITGYLFLWVIAYLFQLLRKKQGMGHGDFKMLAMFGAWLGVIPLLHIILISVLLGLAVHLSLLMFRKIKRDQALPFGPSLAFSGWLVLLFGSLWSY